MLFLIWMYGPNAQYNEQNTDKMEESMPVVKLVDTEQRFSSTMPKSLPMLRYTGPCASSWFHETQRFYIEQILSNNTWEVDRATAEILERDNCVDIQIIALSYQALSKMKLQGRLDEAEALFRTALDKSRSPDCETSVILEGRLLEHYASLLKIMGKHNKALEFIDEAKVKLFNTAPSFEKAVVIFVEIMLRQKHLTLSDTTEVGNWYQETLEIERNFELLVNYSNCMEEYEKPAICMFLICKAEFHLRSSQIMGDLPPEDRRPTEDDLQKAEACLKGVQMEIFPTQVNYYKAQYYLNCLVRPSFVETRIFRSYCECQKCKTTVPSREDHK